jgi:hypothetical protein
MAEEISVEEAAFSRANRQLHLKCHAFGCTNDRIPATDNVVPSPEFFRPDQGSRGLTRSQQFQ